MEQTTATPRTTLLDGDLSWHSFALFAGGARQLDAVVEHAVGPAVAVVQPRRWAFARWVDDRGPHIRLALEATHAVAELRDALWSGVRSAASAAPSDRLLALPASWRGPTDVTVAPVALAPGEHPVDPLHELSSELAMRALRALGGARARGAYALAVMSATATALGHAETQAFWKDVAERWAGGGELLARLDARAGDQELLALCAQHREVAVLEQERARYAAACAELRDLDRVRLHVHMSVNRLGVSPLEEAMLALVLHRGRPQQRPRQRPGEDSGDVAGREHREAENAVLVLRDVGCSGAEGPTLQGISLRVRRGEIVVLLGPRHATARVLALAGGLCPPSTGSVDAPAGEPSFGLRHDELAPEASVRENIELHLRATGRSGAADALLAGAVLSDHAGTLAADLPPGERRRLAIACALARDPAVLLLDAPTAGLSAVDREAVWAVLARRRARGGAIVLTTSCLQDALAVGDRAALVEDDRAVMFDSLHELAQERFAPTTLHIRVTTEPDRALLEDLPEVEHVEIDERIDHWALALRTRQPEELRALLDADPDFADIVDVDQAVAR